MTLGRLAASIVLILLTTSTANAASILFTYVSHPGGAPGPAVEGADLVSFLEGAGHDVDYVDLRAGPLGDFSQYSQVWVYDLSAFEGEFNGIPPTLRANFTAIANWYTGLDDENLIADARIFSSATSPFGPGEPAWIQNYAAQLDAAGGGLVLGTNHDAYASGINIINDLIGIGSFVGNDGFTQGTIGQAIVAPGTALYLPGLPGCASSPLSQCLNDNFIGGFAPFNLQPNGQVLYPVAFHVRSGQVAISTTLERAAPIPDPTPVPEPASLLLFGIGTAGLLAGGRHKRY